MEQVRQAALETVYPETGFAPEDPRLTPVGMPLVAYAVAARAVGWANEDDALIERVVTALGHTRQDYDAAGDALDSGAQDRHGDRDPLRPAVRERRRPAGQASLNLPGQPCFGLGISSVASSPPAVSQAPTTRAASRRGL